MIDFINAARKAGAEMVITTEKDAVKLSGAKFVLLKSPAANAPLSGWTRVATNTVTPGTFTITTGSAQEFYSIKSE